MNERYFKKKLAVLKVCRRDDEKIAILKTIFDDGYREKITEIQL